MARAKADRGSSPQQSVARIAVNLLLITVTLVGAAHLVPALLGYERYVITGGSMSGSIEKGALVIEKRVPVEQLEVGDVITYLPPPDSGVTTLVTHRIVSVSAAESGSRLFRTQGDANRDPDPWKFSLTGRTQPVASWSVPLVGYVFIALADRETRMLVVGVPAGLVALMSLVELTRAVHARRGPSPHSSPA